MNILIPHTWLLEHLDTQATQDEISKYLSLSGPSVERIEEREGEPVYDIEVTTNRVDMMSVRGIAREAATILPEFGIPAQLKPLALPRLKPSSPLDLEIINDASVCHRILAIKLASVNLRPSPDWLKKRLLQVGQRPLNNAIDITNYVMWEIGHPIHAFDYDKITSKKILVREAKKGEKLTTLDDKTHSLQGGEIVFDNGEGVIIDLPGIMGTKNTVVTNQTKNVLLWIESIEATKIRHASMGLAIRSQAAVLNEKHVDPHLGKEAILKSIDLFKNLTKADVASDLYDDFPSPQQPQPTRLTQSKLDTYLGVHVPENRVTRILKNLNCEVDFQKDTFIITPPTFRQRDLQIPQDYIEEVARIYGYHNLESQIMATPIPDNPPQEDFHWEHRLKQWLAGWGLQEIYTYSMVSADIAKQWGYDLKNHLKLKNPLSDDWAYLRRSLIPSLAEVIESNHNPNLMVFEMQNVYHPGKKSTDLPTEVLHLTVATGPLYPQLKGVLDALTQKLNLNKLTVEPAELPLPFLKNQAGRVKAGNQLVGSIGIVKIGGKRYAVLDLEVAPLYKAASLHPSFIPVHQTPPIIEDMTFTLPPKTYVQPVISALSEQHPLIEAVNLKDTYEHNYTFTITYRDSQKSLTDAELAPIRKQISQSLKKRFQAVLVGTLE